MIRRPPRSTLFPYTTALPISVVGPFRSVAHRDERRGDVRHVHRHEERRHATRPLLEQGATVLLEGDRKSTRLNSSHLVISYAVFCLKKKKDSRRRAFGLITESEG